MRKITLFLMSLFLTVGAMAQQVESRVLGVNSIPETKVDLSNGLTSGYYLLKQVNDATSAASGQGVGWIKAASETAGASATSKNTGTPNANDATYVWYVDVIEDNKITISTANKVAAWQAPWQRQKNLVAYSSKATLKYHTGTVNLSGDATPKDGSCFISNEEATAYVHFSGDSLGSWTDTNQNSMFMVEFYELSEDNLNRQSLAIYTVTYNYMLDGNVVATVPHKVIEGSAYPDLISGLYGVTVDGTKPSGNVTADSENNFNVTIGEQPFEYYDSYEAVEAANGWYNLVMHSNWNTGNGTGRYRTYLSHNEGGSVLAWGTERSLTNPSNAHYWAFVGDPINGFRVVNKAKGEGYVLSSNGSANPLMLEEATLSEGNNTTWQIAKRKYDVSQTGDYIIEGAWFCLKHTNGQYMNANATNGNVAFWSDNDNGSGILAVKPLVIDEAADYATYYSDNYVIMPSTMNAEVYYVNGVENGYAKLDTISGEVIPAQTGVVVKYDTASDVVYAPEITSEGETEAIAGNLLKGTTKRTLINKDANKAYYALGLTEGIGFYNAVNGENTNEFYNNAFKAYLEIDNTSGVAMSASLRFDFGGTTGIEEVEIRNEKEEIYDLTGRRVNEITKAGVYIIGGRKILVK